MNFLQSVVDWFDNGDHWTGAEGIPHLLWQHVQISFIAVLAAVVIALPIGLFFGHHRRGGFVAINLANVGRALPALALLLFAVKRFGVGDPPAWMQTVGIGSIPTFLVLVALAIPTDRDQHLRRGERGRPRDDRCGGRHGDERRPGAAPGRAAARVAADHGGHSHLGGRSGRDRDARRARRLGWSRSLHHRRLPGAGLRAALRGLFVGAAAIAVELSLAIVQHFVVPSCGLALVQRLVVPEPGLRRHSPRRRNDLTSPGRRLGGHSPGKDRIHAKGKNAVQWPRSGRCSWASSSCSPPARRTARARAGRRTSSKALIVGSKDFAGAQILSQAYGQTLEAKGYKITYKDNIGPSETVYPLLEKGDIDLYGEFSGTFLTYLKGTPTGERDRCSPR